MTAALRRFRPIAPLFAIGLVASFLATYAMSTSRAQPASAPGARGGQSALQGIPGWLNLSAEQRTIMAQLDPDFVRERAALEVRLADERHALADAFEKTDTSDAEIEACVERVQAAQQQLEDRILKHLLLLRPHLTAEQRHELLHRCATTVRGQGGGYGGPPPQNNDDARRGRGRGGPPWRRSAPDSNLP